jgi:aspartyl protease family protein
MSFQEISSRFAAEERRVHVFAGLLPMTISSGTRAVVGEALSWLAAAAICVAGFVYYSDFKAVTLRSLGYAEPRAAEASAPATRSHGVVEIRAGESGHFHAEAEINGRSIPVLVDTGATMLALTYEDAETAGILLRPSDFTQSVATANGIARVAPVTVDRVSIGDITVRGVAASVSEPGRLKMTLLGMSFLGRLERVDMRAGVLLLQD